MFKSKNDDIYKLRMNGTKKQQEEKKEENSELIYVDIGNNSNQKIRINKKTGQVCKIDKSGNVSTLDTVNETAIAGLIEIPTHPDLIIVPVKHAHYNIIINKKAVRSSTIKKRDDIITITDDNEKKTHCLSHNLSKFLDLHNNDSVYVYGTTIGKAVEMFESTDESKKEESRCVVISTSPLEEESG